MEMFSMLGESDLVESFIFGQGRTQIPSFACLFDSVIWNEWFTEEGYYSFVSSQLDIYIPFFSLDI